MDGRGGKPQHGIPGAAAALRQLRGSAWPRHVHNNVDIGCVICFLCCRSAAIRQRAVLRRARPDSKWGWSPRLRQQITTRVDGQARQHRQLSSEEWLN
jgi:hypothetical protein